MGQSEGKHNDRDEPWVLCVDEKVRSLGSYCVVPLPDICAGALCRLPNVCVAGILFLCQLLSELTWGINYT
jgi:hypothetical protein